jgi:DNA-directed RNA polymerase sigma subunit (sigma70/sigma32)
MTEKIHGNDDNPVDFENLVKQIKLVLQHLTSFEREVISSRFGLIDGKLLTLNEIEMLHKVSHDEIRNIEEKLLNLLVRQSSYEKLRPYLD